MMNGSVVRTGACFHWLPLEWITEGQENCLVLPYGKTPKDEGRVMDWMFDNVGRLIAWLQKPATHCEPFPVNESMALRDTLRPGDVLLVEGKGRISGSIKYLTQSTWSHSALYVGPMAGAAKSPRSATRHIMRRATSKFHLTSRW